MSTETVRYTPGPWEARKDSDDYWHVVAPGTIEFGEPYAVAVLDDDFIAPVAGYNARLIAAAPKLLEALTDMTILAEGPPTGVTVAMKRDVIAKARAAIAAARGEET